MSQFLKFNKMEPFLISTNKSSFSSLKNYTNCVSPNQTLLEFDDDIELNMLIKPIEKFSIIVNGPVIDKILNDDELTKTFIQTAKFAETVIICRATPKHKSLVVEKVKYLLKVQTLAIGDGANDVAMIQSAHVGIGIQGNEGSQAANNADFVIPKFYFLKKLMFVYGHWNYQRASDMLLYFIKKHSSFGLLGVLVQCLALFYTVISIDDIMFFLFNVIFNSLPPVISGTFDKHFESSTLQRNAELYKYGKDSYSSD